MCNVILMVFGGLVIGLVARWLYPGVVPMGVGTTILLGIGGSLVAGLAGWWAGQGGRGAFRQAGCLGSILGAMLLIFLARHLGWHW